ncbi:MAG: hypothetical protein ACFB4J_17060 [Elainellaceae cyanobacterium]
MTSVFNTFQAANHQFRRADHARWHRLQSKRHILRSQLGFQKTVSSRPKVCIGCIHYHGLAYGQSPRTVLICGFYPYGWAELSACPDWTPAA